MKKILILVDPENIAMNVAASCIMLAAEISANLILFSTYFLLPAAGIYAGTPWVEQGILQWELDTKEKLKAFSAQLNTKVNALDADLYKPTIDTYITEGNLGASVQNFIEANEIEMVVMGAKSSSTMEQLLLGSDTQSVINECKRPILIIPKDVTLEKVEKITYATDFNPEEIKSLTYLVHLGGHLHFQLEIVHILKFGEDEKSMASSATEFKELVNGLNYPHINYTIISGKDVIQDLTNFSENNHSALLAMTHYQHSFFGRLLNKSMTKRAISNQRIPLLVLPSGGR